MAKQNNEHNTECKSELHDQHLCYIISQGFHLTDEQEYNAIVKDAQFKCQHCGRIAKSDQSLCEPAKL